MTTDLRESYWERREHLQYYRIVHEYAKKYCQNGSTLLDVGGGVGKGCRYLEWYNQYERTSVELLSRGKELEGVRVINADFLDWEVDQEYDLVLCLQVLEHVARPFAFARKLKECGKLIIVSVPYRWSPEQCEHHWHDPVDGQKLRSWMKLDPVETAISAQSKLNPGERSICNLRLVAVYA